MILNVSASYQPNEDEVWVDFNSTQDDGITATVADDIEVELLIENENDVGTVSYITISTLKITSDYVTPEKHYEMKFRNPQRSLGLWLSVNARYGLTTVQKRVSVGQALPSHTQMDLPDNTLWEEDPFAMPPTLGEDYTPNANTVILAPEIRLYSNLFDFTVSSPQEDFDGLTYTGGGDRLLISNQNDRFEFQALDKSPWELSTFAFLENASNNLTPNPFFQNVINPTSSDNAFPQYYEVDAAGALLLQTVAFDYAVSETAKIWSLRFIQSNPSPAFNQVEIKLSSTVAIAGSTQYTFSTYSKVRNLTRFTDPDNLTLRLAWYNGSTFISDSLQQVSTNQYRQMGLVSVTATSPATATHVRPSILLSTIDSGDDVEMSLLGFQIETGDVPTTRMNGNRAADQISIDTYNAENQKFRMEVLPGFASGISDRVLITGPLLVTFKATDTLEIQIPEAATTLTVPLAFQAGDILDLAIEHQAGKKVAAYRDGVLLGDTVLPVFTGIPGPLNILGVGVELLKLTVFSRRGD